MIMQSTHEPANDKYDDKYEHMGDEKGTASSYLGSNLGNQTSESAIMATTQQAIIAGGCFWCTEAVFRDVIGVSEVESGYIGGTVENPTYKQVCTGTTGHAEGIRVTFDPHAISLAEIFDVFLGTHDPTQLNRQGGDIGTQYRSAIFPLDDAQFAEAEAAITRWNDSNSGTAVTTIEAASTWYPAEDYHQEYWEGEGKSNPYCLAVIPPKIMKLRKSFQDKVKS